MFATNRICTFFLVAFVTGCGGTVGGGSGGGSATGGGTATGGGGESSGGGAAVGGGTATGGGIATGGGTATGGGSAGGSGGAPTGNQYLPDPVVTGQIRRVCPSGCTHALPSAALAAAVNGDTIEIDGATYTDCANVTKDNLIIRGVATPTRSRPKIGGKVCGRKGIFVVSSRNVLFENLELADAIDPTSQDRNWAGIRLETVATAENLKVRNVYFHDCDDGVLGNDGTHADNTVVIESSQFERLGREGYAHGMYIGAGVTKLVVRNTTVTNNRDDGHLVKSRAKQTILECNRIAGLNGKNSYAADFPNGGDVTIRDTVLQNGPMVQNSGNYLVMFGEENGLAAPHAFTMQNTWLISDLATRGKMNFARTATIANWSGNTYVGSGNGVEVIGVTGSFGFTNHSTRAAASLPAYDMTLGSIPMVPTCP